MDAVSYRLALAGLGLSHSKASEVLEISKRTSLRYAKTGVPAYANRIRRRLDKLADARKEDKK